MFGYVSANLKDLSEEEKQRYRGAYCGLCRTLRKDYGQLSRFSLTYDLTFLALLLGSLYEPPQKLSTIHCPVNLARPQSIVQTRYTTYAAQLSVALAYHKSKDDWADERKLSARLYVSILEKHYAEVKEQIPRQCQAIEEGLAAISAIEEQALAQTHVQALAWEQAHVQAYAQEQAPTQEQAQAHTQARTQAQAKSKHDAQNGEAKNGDAETAFDPQNDTKATFDPQSDIDPNPDAAANCFGKLLGELFVYHEDTWAQTLRNMGEQLGRFIYFMDAACDIERDKQQGSYNPLAGLTLSKQDIDETLILFAGRATQQFEKLPLEQDLHLLRSVLYSGIWQKRNAQEAKKTRRTACAKADPNGTAQMTKKDA